MVLHTFVASGREFYGSVVVTVNMKGWAFPVLMGQQVFHSTHAIL